MKKSVSKFKLILALFVAMLIGAVTVQAQTTYDLWICGTQVTALNKDNLAVIPGVTGTVSYNPVTKILRLENASITITGNVNAVYSKIENLTIELIGNSNTINVNAYSPLHFEGKPSTILGGGTLTITNWANDYAICVSGGASLTIKNCTVNAIGGKRGITGSGNQGTLSIENATVTAKGTSEGSITYFANISLNGCIISEPIGGRISTDVFVAVRDSAGNIIKNTVKIVPTYDLWICSKQVTGANKNNLNTIPGVTGKINYNPNTKTLTLDSVTIAPQGKYSAISSKLDGLKIELIGNNTIDMDTVSASGIFLDSTSATINGNGVLNVSSTKEAIVASKSSLSIKNCKVNSISNIAGISGAYTNSSLSIDNATVTAIGTSNGSIIAFNGGISLTNSIIVQPIGAKITGANVTDTNGTIIKTEVKIIAIYDLWICGTQVTALNKDSLAVISGVTGAVNYNSATKTLTLNNASLSTTGSTCCILSRINNMRIDVVGTNMLTANGWSPIAYEDNNSGIIQGNGTLNAINHHANDQGIYMRNGSLTIKNCTINTIGGNSGILGGSGNQTLTIENATISALGTNQGSIKGFKQMNLNNCAIVEPAFARFNTTQKAICNASGNVIKDTIKIVPVTTYALLICGVQVTDFNKDSLNIIPGVTAGTINYAPATKTLTLNNASMSTTSSTACIYSITDSLIIEIIGNNTLNGNGWSPISCDSNNSCFIQGNGTLNINNSSNNGGIFMRNGSLSIKNCTLNVIAGNHGISGSSGEKTLTIDNATVLAKGTNGGSILGFKQINLVNSAIIQPAGAIFNDTAKAICDTLGVIIKDTVKITPFYYLKICGVQVNATNKDSLAVIPGVTGTVNYNPTTKTLRLENTTITITGNVNAIHSATDGLTIELIGNNTVTSNGWSAIEFDGKSGTILGNGTLTVTNHANGYGIYASSGASLTIKNCTLNVAGGKRGITGSGNQGTLGFENATVTASDASEGSITRFSDIYFNDCAISEPFGAYIGAVTATPSPIPVLYVLDNKSNIITDTVKIVPAYDLYISTIQVTIANKDSLAVIPGITGKVTYNPSTKTLRLENASITTDSALLLLPYYSFNLLCIYSLIDSLKIEVVGNNNLSSDKSFAICLEKFTTIEGSGTLNIYNSAIENGISMTDASLNIKNCTLNITANNRGIFCLSDEKTLTIDNATISAKGTHNGSISGFKQINFVNSAIIQPAGAMFNDTVKAICDTSGNVIKDTIKIVPAYDLKVCGVQVNDANKDSLGVISGVTGTVTYNPTTKTLTLNDATITSSTEAQAIESNIEGLTVDLKGNNDVSSSTWSTMRFNKSGTIMGSGTLNVSHTTGGWALYSNCTSLTIKSCTVNAISGNRAITGNSNGMLTINNATITAKGTGGSITHFSSIILDSCAIFDPIGGRINKGSDSFNAIRDSADSVITDTVKILPATVYNLHICGVQVTSLNKNNLNAISGISAGTVSYNSDNKTLTLNGVTMSTTGNTCCILSRIDSMIIEVVGTNNLTTNAWSPISYEDDNSGIIQGNGTLNAINHHANDQGIYMRNGSLTIKNCTINTIGGNSGILGGSGNQTLTIENATILALGANQGSIFGFKQINLNNCAIVEPAFARFNTTQKAICDTLSNVIKDTVKIVPTYDLKVCGVQVNNANKDSLGVISGVTGTVTYNPTSKTLTLNNATITSSTEAQAIESNIEGLIVDLKGNNDVSSSTWSTMRFNKSGTIMGSGTLNVSHTTGGWALYSNCTSLTIKSCTVNAISGNRAITGNSNGMLTINNATVTAKGTGGSITHFSSIILDSCAIFEPIGGRINKGSDSFNAVRDSTDSVITDTVKIAPATVYNLHICGVQVTSLNKNNLSAIPGVSAGTVNYSPNTKTLSLNGVTMSTTGNTCCILSRIDSMIIEVVGTNNLTTNAWSPISYEDDNSGIIQGNGTLNAINHHANDQGIYMRNGSLTIKNCTINTIGGNSGILGGSGNQTLTIENATILALGANQGSIFGFKQINLNNCAIVEPAFARFNTTQKAICDTLSNVIKDTVKIVPTYDLKVCGVQVNDANKDSLAVISGVSGKVSYNPGIKTLRLENATINASTSIGILSKIEGLTIDLIGNNAVNNNANLSTIQFDGKSGTILGGGTLSVTNQANDFAIFASDSASLTIKNCTINAIGGNRGITGNGNSPFTIQNATVTAKGTGGSITHFSSIILDSCAIFEPIGGRVSKGTNTYYSVHNLADSVITDTIKILPATVYNLQICGVQVTSLNKNNLSAIPGVSAGTVSYNSDNKTLALNGATMSTTGNTCCILSRIDSMKIDVVGTNNLMGNGWSPISFEGDNSGTIEGSGTLNINNSADNGGIFIRNGLLNIKNCTLNVTAGDRGISSPSGEKTLTFDRATVSATGTNGGSIVGFKQIDFINCDIIQPEDAMFNDTVKAICDASGNIIKTEVKIAPTYIITFAAPENGTLTVKLNNADIISGDKVFMGSEITITATPDANYKLKTLTVNGTAFESGNTHSVVADVNIMAEFEKEDGIEEIDAQDITLYPNPVKDILFIETEEAIKAVHIYNVQGAVVVESIGDIREINLAHLPAGIYTLRVEIGKTVSTLRIIKN
ncbi:MAG: T9SS type A sorting domain-containing protein [Bacteroidales bacterium]|jgi:hypothetical protein